MKHPMYKKILFLLNKDSDYFANHLRDVFNDWAIDTITLKSSEFKRNINILEKKLLKNEYEYLFVTAGNVLIKINNLRRFKNYTKILFLTDDDWQFYQFSRFYGHYFDWIITTYKKNLTLYEKHGFVNVIYSQWGVNTKFFHPVITEDKIDVSLIGAPHSDRKELAGYLIKNNIQIKLFGSGWEKTEYKKYSGGYLDEMQYPYVINQSKINICTLRSGDESTLQVKGRIFEIAACNSFQLVEHNPLLFDYFTEDEIITYENYNDLNEKINYYLNNERERKKIAQKAFTRVMIDHTWEKRITKIFNVIRNNASKKTLPIKTDSSVTIIYENKNKSVFNKCTIDSINNQTYSNISLSLITSNPNIDTKLKYPFTLYEKYSDALNDIKTDYVSFIEDGDIWENEKTEFQVFALENDRQDAIVASMANYSLYDERIGSEIFYYSFTDTRKKGNFDIPFMIVPSSLMISREHMIEIKENYHRPNISTFQWLNSNLCLINERDFRIIDIQYCLAKLPISKIKEWLKQAAEQRIYYADFWHWSKPNWQVIVALAFRLRIKSIYCFIKSYFKSNPIIQSYLSE